MAESRILTHRIDGCMRNAAPDRLAGVTPHELRFASMGGAWGQAGNLANGDYYTKLDLDKIQESLEAGELGYPEEAALPYRSPLSEAIHFVLGHEYVHHKWPDSPHGRLFNSRAEAIRKATRECK